MIKRTLFFVVVVFAFLAVTIVDTGFCHTRERKRIDVLENTVKKDNATLMQRISVAEQTLKYNTEAVKERREHGKRLEKRMLAVEKNATEGLRAVRDTLAREIDSRLTILKAESKTQSQLISSLQTSVKTQQTTIIAQQKSLTAQQNSLTAINESLTGFRKYLATYTGKNDKNVDLIHKGLQSQKAVYDKKFKELVLKIDSLLKIVDEENRKLRIAIARASGSSGAGKHTVVAGDNLWNIARKYDVSRDQLLSANPKLKGYSAVIHPGDTLNIP